LLLPGDLIFVRRASWFLRMFSSWWLKYTVNARRFQHLLILWVTPMLGYRVGNRILWLCCRCYDSYFISHCNSFIPA